MQKTLCDFEQNMSPKISANFTQEAGTIRESFQLNVDLKSN
jgi:hypothetical protein